ncbi:MAG: glycosyltransferase [Dehalococcoidia bacterium]
MSDCKPAIIQYWHREKPPEQIVELMATFRARNPGMRHLVFDESGAAGFIEERYGARHAAVFRSCAVPAMQADFFRFCAVHALGGIYADANFACRRDLRPLLEPVGQLFARPPLGPVLNGVFAFRSPEHPLLGICIEVATRNIELRISEVIGLIGGTAILTGLTHLHRGGRLEDLRELPRPRWRAEFDACLDQLNESVRGAIDEHGPLEKAFAGVRISERSEMLTFVKKPKLRFENPDGHWAHWQGAAFREPGEARRYEQRRLARD